MDKEIVDMFQQESQVLIKELEEILEELEKPQMDFPIEELEGFSQRVDRMMGAAKILEMSVVSPDGSVHPGLGRIGKICELCKALGYRAAQLKQKELVPLFVAFWSDTIEVLGSLVNNIQDIAKSKEIASSFSKVLEKRLEWLVSKIGKAAPPPTAGATQASVSINDLADLTKLLQG